ncbi:MAG: hypothetical protein ACYSW3_00445 [Planctomycetota bacterium]|jgi:hypothetical protein
MSNQLTDHSGAITYEELLRETDGAYLLRIDGKDHWFPKTQCRVEESHQLVEIPIWLAISRGLEGYLEEE